MRDFTDTVPERRRTAEGDFYQEQYPDQRIYSRHCGTLPMVKGTNVMPVPSLSLQGSSIGRSVGTLDSRSSGKDMTGKRVRLVGPEIRTKSSVILLVLMNTENVHGHLGLGRVRWRTVR